MRRFPTVLLCLIVFMPEVTDIFIYRNLQAGPEYCGDGFCLSIPDSWGEAEMLNGEQTMFLGPKVGNSHMAFYVTKLPKEGKTYIDAATKTKQQRSASSRYSILDEGDISQPGFKAYQRRSTWYAEDIDMMLIAREIFTESEDAVYILSCSIPNSPNLEELDTVAKNIFSSFRFSGD